STSVARRRGRCCCHGRVCCSAAGASGGKHRPRPLRVGSQGASTALLPKRGVVAGVVGGTGALPSRVPTATVTSSTTPEAQLDRLEDWFASRGWQPWEFQRRAWQASLAGRSGLISVPTGAGK